MVNQIKNKQFRNAAVKKSNIFDLGKDVATKERLQIVLNGITQHFTRLRLCWDEAIVSIKYYVRR